jgi:hypothetical protein
MRIDPNDRPAFCSECYCERCGVGFYARRRDGIKFNDGKYVCVRTGCVGQLRLTPLLSWRRTRPCRECGATGREQLTA